MNVARAAWIAGLGILMIAAFPVPQRAGANDGGKALDATEGLTSFAFELYDQLRGQDGNLFLSPYSITSAASMVYAGARGETEEQMAAVLGFGTDQAAHHASLSALQDALGRAQESGEVELSQANGLWIQDGLELEAPFLHTMQERYAAGPVRVDFRSAPEAVRSRINAWVEEQTRERIRDLMPPGVIDGGTRMVLVNAIYFKGGWRSTFSEHATREQPFHLLDGSTVPAPLMTQTGAFAHCTADGLQILELPYMGDDLVMTVLLPEANDGLPELEARLAPDRLEEWLDRLRVAEVRVVFPRFEMTSKFRLGETLAAMGMPLAFSDEADFTGITDQERLRIQAVVHKAFVQVNEEGTEAAAATGIGMAPTSVRPEPVVFRADHPFVFLIRHPATGTILFMGRLVAPAA
ncbi:MAG: serpin family protein [Candidatus Eiseniibacteriota bacterium]|jgi:serpin B